MELLCVENFCVGYGRQKVVEKVSFSVKEGETAGIFGENGCGKTTLLKGIAGLIPGTAGKVYVGGRDVPGMTARKRAGLVSMLFSGAEVPEGILAEEVLEMGWYARLRFLQPPGGELQREKEAVVRELAIEGLLSKYFGALSQGQKQMVLTGRMLLQNTPVFLMDEPDNSLDFKHRHGLLRKVRTMAAEKRKAGLIVLHDPSLAMSYCDRVFLMREGRIADVVCPGEETEEEIAEKIRDITGLVQVTKQGTSVIISPEYFSSQR